MAGGAPILRHQPITFEQKGVTVRLPRIKREHSPHRYPDGTIRIGGGVYGIAAEISDPYGWVWFTLSLFDGKHAIQDILDGLQEKFPNLDPHTIVKIVDQLVWSGYAEDAVSDPSPELNSDEKDRYSRNRSFFRSVDLQVRSSTWDSQIRLKKSAVLILGVGGTGSHAAWALAAAGVGRIHCIDGDVVELSNLTRQALYSEDDLGLPKVEVIARKLNGVNSRIEITTSNRMIESLTELSPIVREFDAVALCADRPRKKDGDIKDIVARACSEANIPWVGGGYNGPVVTVGVYGPGGPCHKCLASGEEARLKPGHIPHIGGTGTIAPSAGISGQLVSYELISILTGVARRAPGYIRGINLIAPDQLIYVRHPARATCDLCRQPDL